MIVKFLIYSGLLMFTKSYVDSQDVGFPEKPEESPSRRNSKQRIPVYMPDRCGENELLYPGDQDDVWVCDCYPTYVFEPQSNNCHPVHMQGPCPDGQILIIPPNTSIPACVLNNCDKDFVEFRHQNGTISCELLRDPEPCSTLKSIKPYVVGVNETTLEVACVPAERYEGTHQVEQDGDVKATSATPSMSEKEPSITDRGTEAEPKPKQLKRQRSKVWMKRMCSQVQDGSKFGKKNVDIPLIDRRFGGDEDEEPSSCYKWISRTAYVFEPNSNKCHPVYMQGPCPEGQILIIPANTSIPACVNNSCDKDFVEYRHPNGTVHCERLHDPEPCRNFRSSKPYVIGINETTLEVACVPAERNDIQTVTDSYVETTSPNPTKSETDSNDNQVEENVLRPSSRPANRFNIDDGKERNFAEKGEVQPSIGTPPGGDEKPSRCYKWFRKVCQQIRQIWTSIRTNAKHIH